MAGAFICWVNYAAWSVSRTSNLQKALNRLEKGMMRKALGAWQLWKIHTRRLGCAAERVAVRVQQRVVSTAFDSWCRYTSKGRVARRALTVTQRKRIAICLDRAFVRWCGVIEDEKQHAAVALLRTQLARQQDRGATSIRARQQSAAVANAYSVWVGYASRSIRSKRIVAKTTTRRSLQSLHRALADWRTWLAAKATRRPTRPWAASQRRRWRTYGPARPTSGRARLQTTSSARAPSR